MPLPGTKACVILGAGASYDARNESSPVKRIEMRPPMAEELFNIEENPIYWNEVMFDSFPGAATPAAELSPSVGVGGHTLEGELRRLFDDTDERIEQLFKDVPAYIRDLIHKCSIEYTDMPGCYVQLALQLLSHTEHEVLFLMLNYDTLLEQALGRVDSRLTYGGREPHRDFHRYVEDDRQAKVVKIHGSTNWFMPFAKNNTGTWHEALRDFDLSPNPPKDGLGDSP